MSQYAIMVDLERCLGCRSCETACKLENGVPVGRYRTRVLWVNPEPGGRLGFVPMPCMHCGEPACRAVCPTGAIVKRPEDGVVLIDKARCIGCRYCAWACPYGAMAFDDARRVADKCTYCAHRLARGETPACVSKCAGRALSFGRVDELLAAPGVRARLARVLATGGTRPSTLYLERPGR
jgi:Fe-S-cluster-containing dehydrogenase component